MTVPMTATATARDRQPMYQFGSNNGYKYARPSPPRNNNYNYAPGTAPPPLRPSGSVYRAQQAPGLDGTFTFRYDAPPTISAAQLDAYRPRSPPRRSNLQENSNSYRQGQNNRGGRYRGRAGPRMASDRQFLKGNRDPTPELMPGITEEQVGARYKPIEDV